MSKRKVRTSTRTLTVKLPAELDEQLSGKARRDGVSKSLLVREALGSYLAEGADVVTALTVFDVAGEAMGRVAGPGLAATDPERMKGYGR